MAINIKDLKWYEQHNRDLGHHLLFPITAHIDFQPDFNYLIVDHMNAVLMKEEGTKQPIGIEIH